MNVFTPYPSPLDCAKALYGDRRFQKQILEIDQIIRSIEGAIPWSKHPCVLMYKDHKEWLRLYQKCFIAYREYMKGNEGAFRLCCFYDTEANRLTPEFLDESFCKQHSRRLYTKNPEHYKQFAQYGKSEENWYYVNGEIVKYINGKRI